MRWGKLTKNPGNRSNQSWDYLMYNIFHVIYSNGTSVHSQIIHVGLICYMLAILDGVYYSTTLTSITFWKFYRWQNSIHSLSLFGRQSVDMTFHKGISSEKLLILIQTKTKLSRSASWNKCHVSCFQPHCKLYKNLFQESFK